MLRSIAGEVLDIMGSSILLDVNGLGFEVICSRSVLDGCKTGEHVRLVTNLQFSETGAVLYGFNSEREREFFLKLTAVKGVGGRTGIAILSALSIDEVISAVSSADISVFMRVPGIGKKTAERLCFELKNLSALKSSESEKIPVQGSSSPVSAVIDALLSLGFSQADAGGVINLLRAAHGEEFSKLDEESLLRLALRELHNGKGK